MFLFCIWMCFWCAFVLYLNVFLMCFCFVWRKSSISDRWALMDGSPAQTCLHRSLKTDFSQDWLVPDWLRTKCSEILVSRIKVNQSIKVHPLKGQTIKWHKIVFFIENVQVFGCCLNNHFQRYEVTSVLHYGLHYKSISNVSCDIWFRNTFPGFQMTASMICNPGPVWGVGGI